MPIKSVSLGDELPAAFRTATAQDPTATLGGHARAKPMGALAAYFARLVGALHRPQALQKKAGKAKPAGARVSTRHLKPSALAPQGINSATPSPPSHHESAMEQEHVDPSVWIRCVRALEAELPEQQFNTWVRPLQVLEGAGALKLLAPNRFVVEWVNANLLPRIGELLQHQSTGDAPIITVEVGSRSAPAPAPLNSPVRPRRAEGLV